VRIHAQPPWLPLDPDPAGRAAVVEHICKLLEQPQAMVSLLASPGVGATAVLGAVAQRCTPRLAVCAARLAGCADLPGIFHAIGFALAAPFPRDQASVCEALAAAGPILLILDDADVPGAESAVERLAAVAPEARFLAAGRAPVFSERVVQLPPLLGTDASELDPALPATAGRAAAAGNLVLRQVGRVVGTEDPWAFLDDLPESADLLAAFPAGIPGLPPRALPPALLLPTSPDRCALRRCVAEALRVRRPREPADLALALVPRVGHLLRVAEEPSRATPIDPADLAVVAFVAQHHPDPAEATRARAAWSRHLVASGQASAARVWQSAADRTRGDCLLAWAEGDALLADGEIDGAMVAWEFAVAQLRRQGDARLLAAVHLRCADLLLGRGALDPAEEHAQAAAEWYVRLEEPLGLAQARRTQAAVRLAQGRAGDAVELLGGPAEGWAPGQQPASGVLTAAAVALHSGDLPGAGEHLAEARQAGPVHPLLRGLLERLEGELALRHDQPDRAGPHLERAVSWFSQGSDRAALGRALRLLGDAAALAGDPAGADERYQRATREQVRAGDMRGLTRTLEHRVLLEREQGSPEVAAELEELMSQVEALCGGS
jgi:tetratricopeptide (TPR) repeat protein